MVMMKPVQRRNLRHISTIGGYAIGQHEYEDEDKVAHQPGMGRTTTVDFSLTTFTQNMSLAESCHLFVSALEETQQKEEEGLQE